MLNPFGLVYRALLLLTLVSGLASAQEKSPGAPALTASGSVETHRDLQYKTAPATAYERERCVLDLTVPTRTRDFPTLVWFHGGGLEHGDKSTSIAQSVVKRFTDSGIAVASVNYRLSPRVHYPAYVEDAAAAVAFIRRNIEKWGGDPRRVFVSGHSAGAYLTTMLAVAPEHLERQGIQPGDLAGYIPVSGQMMTHYTIRKERGLPKDQPLIDAAAPVWFANHYTPPLLCIWGGQDMPTRAEENEYFVAVMKNAGNKAIEKLMVPGRTHTTIASQIEQPQDPVAQTMEQFIKQHRSSGAQPNAGRLQLEKDDQAIRIVTPGRVLLSYNIQSPLLPEGMDPAYKRSGFLHPVATPGGKVVTATFPTDHPHQHGIFSAWVQCTYQDRKIDFWNLAGRTGRVLHERTVSTFQHPDSVGFEVDLLHRIEGETPIDVLRERWRITARPTDGSYFCFDLESEQQAITDSPLVIQEYHYGGIAVRGPEAWLLPKDKDSVAQASPQRTGATLLNSLGNDRIAGNHAHARWVAMTGTIDGGSASLIAMDHPSNFRAPQAARIHPTKPYFCFAPCVDGAFSIDRQSPYRARFRFLVTDNPPEPAWVDQQWHAWSQQ